MAKFPRADSQGAIKYFQQKLDYTTGPIELNHWLQEKAPIQVVDVRAAEDYQKGHIPGAVNLPKGSWDGPAGLAKDKTHIVYCYSQTCHLAAAAAVEFAKRGFSVMELEGGFNTWQKAQLEIVAGV